MNRSTTNKPYLTVSAINRYIKAVLDSDVHLNNIAISGELSNVKYHYSGHCYFTLKDEKSRINAVMFASNLKKLKFRMEEGMKVLVIGNISVYEATGSYQLYALDMKIDGLGNLYQAYEQLKKKLETEGLFDLQYKKEIPSYATKIGIITASTGAAIHDITQTIHNRCTSCKLYFYPSLVQGENASLDLIRQLKKADKDGLDVIIIGRGGGSIEDLWPFNDETLARTIYNCQTPIISGVGHESDFTICDFVADARAATPTAAATMASFDEALLKTQLNSYQSRIHNLMNSKINKAKDKLNQYSKYSLLARPDSFYGSKVLYLDELTNKMRYALNYKLQANHHQLDSYDTKLKQKALSLTQTEYQTVSHLKEMLMKNMDVLYNSKANHFHYLVSSLNAYSPLNTLTRGYTLTYQNDTIVTSKENLIKDNPIQIQFKDGFIYANQWEDIDDEKNDL